MPTPKLSDELCRQAMEALSVHGTASAAADAMEVDRSTFRHRIRTANARFGKHPTRVRDRDVQSFEPPSEELEAAEIIERRRVTYQRKAAANDAKSYYPVTLKHNRPIALLIHGDPHLDDDSVDLDLVRRHLDIVKDSPDVYGVSVGDVLNNWPGNGRLTKLWAEQDVTKTQGETLLHWFFTYHKKYMAACSGNHDTFGTDFARWINWKPIVPYADSEAAWSLVFKNGVEVNIKLRHSFPGNSMYNRAHGGQKNSMLGTRDDLSISGHVHSVGMSVAVDPSDGRKLTALQVGSYKKYDAYAKTCGFYDSNISPAAFVIIDPRAPASDRITTYLDPEYGLKVFQAMR